MQNILFWKKVCHFIQETDMSSIAMIYGSINIYAMFNFTETLKTLISFPKQKQQQQQQQITTTSFIS